MCQKAKFPLVPMLGAVFGDVIGPDPRNVVFGLYLYKIVDRSPDRGTPSLVNLGGTHGSVRVRIRRNGELLYQHPHRVRELVGEHLRELLRKRDPDVQHWGYRLSSPGLESIASVGMEPG
jgi:JAB N-terminal domain